MNDVNEMWGSPWRTLQKNLANGFPIEESNPWDCGSPFSGGAQSPRDAQIPIRTVHSWLVRARPFLKPIAALLSANCHIGGAVSRQLGARRETDEQSRF